MHVYLLRHGIAEPLGESTGWRDGDRRLTDDGRVRLAAAAPTWARCVVPLDRIYASPLVRAAETAAVLAGAVAASEPLVTLDCLVPEADPALAAGTLLADARAGRRAVALVGHEPHLGALLGLLLQGGGAIPFEPGMLAGVHLPSVTVALGRLVLSLTTAAAGAAAERG